MSQKVTKIELERFTCTVTKALRRAAKTARKTAINSGTPIYVCRSGKVVAIKPKKP
jgi:hypothetical protein